MKKEEQAKKRRTSSSVPSIVLFGSTLETLLSGTGARLALFRRPCPPLPLSGLTFVQPSSSSAEARAPRAPASLCALWALLKVAARPSAGPRFLEILGYG